MSPVRTRSQDALDQAEEDAQILEAAQAQVQEEEEMARRLPREVINLARRMESQQKSVDDLQGNISILTDMVSQLGIKFQGGSSSRSADLETQSKHGYEIPSPPPPQYQLSPILELATPPTTSETPKNPPFVSQPHPSQLPQPNFVPTPPPPTSNHTTKPMNFSQPMYNPQPHGSQFQHTYQTTSPYTHPQNYSPNYQNMPMQTQPPPYYQPNTPTFHNPYIPQPNPYTYLPYQPYPYNQPQFFNPTLPTSHFSYTHPSVFPTNPVWQQQQPANTDLASTRFGNGPRDTPQPAQHTDNRQANAAGEQRQQGQMDPHIRTPSIDLPLFFGDNAQSWVMECDSIFDLAGIENASKIKWANAHIRGKAKTWLNSSGLQLDMLTWPQFCSMLCERFPSPGADESMEQCQQLKQLNSVDNYIDAFEEWMSLMKRDHSYLPENFFLLRFLCGLKDNIKHDTQCCKPATLRSAYWYARKQEQSYLSNLKKATTVVQPRAIAAPNARAVQAREIRPAPAVQKQRERGKCWYCPENWTFGHKCNTVKSMLHAIQLQGHSDEEGETLDNQVDGDIAQQEVVAPVEKLMSISAEALQGIPSDDTISLAVSIYGVPAIALIDSGSSNTFLDKDFAIKHNFPMQEVQARNVQVAGGGKLLSDAVISNCKFSIQKQKFVSDVKILPLKGYDLVLGVSWLKQHNPTKFDWIHRSLTITVDKKEHTFIDHTILKKNCFVTAKKCNELLRKGATGYMIQLFLLTEQATEPENSVTVHHPAIAKILNQYQSLFQPPTGLPPKRDCDHKIILKEGATPPNIRPYRMPHRQKNIVDQLIKEMLQNHEIQPSKSPFSSPALIVTKKDKSWRLCSDFRELNALTVKNKYPIPVIEDLLDELQGAVIFSKLDLRSGYHQIRMSEQDISKTAFRTHSGHYEYLVMPFGLTNAPATFQELMNSIFAEYLRKFVLVFFDDILIYSKSEEEHCQHLHQVLETLQVHQLKAKMSKCTFATPKVEYLGHIISADGVATDPSKIVDIVKWKTPSNVSQLRGFLGLTGYYRRFIKNYATICKPLHAVLKKNAFQWTSVQEEAFQFLKTAMSTPPVLALPNFDLPFVLETDASGFGIGAVLMQLGRPLAFFSKSLGVKAAAQSIYEKEALAILEALRKWRHYLLGNKLVIKSDQKSLKYLSSQRLLEGIQHKLMLKLLEYDYVIEYKKGKENTVADALSRKEEHKQDMDCAAVSVAIPKWINDVAATYTTDEKCLKLLQELAVDPHSHPHYTLTAGILRYKNRIVVGQDETLQCQLFAAVHNSAIGGHSGQKVTLQKLKHLFYWPNMKTFVAMKVSQCPVCQISKTEHVPYPGLLDPLHIPKIKWSEISMDFVEGLPKSRGYDVILVVVDRLTKYAHFVPLAHPFTVQQVSTAFMDNVHKLHGFPQVIVTDRDRIFTSKMWQDMFASLQVELHFSSAYHPESDGQTERVNQCLEQYLRCMAFREPKKWSSWLPAAEWWYNTSYHSSLKTSPFEALYGYPPPQLSELSIPGDIAKESESTLLEQQQMLQSLKQNLMQAQNKMKKFADLKRTERTFQVGDMVYLKMQPYREAALGLRNRLKLTSKFYGPFRILSKVGRVAYKLQLPEGTKMHDVFHVNQLKKHLGLHAVPNTTLPLVTAEGKVKFAPVALLQRRQVPRSAGAYDIPVVQWLIHWENMEPDEATWEDASFIQATFPDFKP